MYLLSTPSSAGSRLRPPPPDGLAATEPGLLRLPPPPGPAAAARPETPRPAREQEGEEPAEVARLLLRLPLSLPAPSAPGAALSMVRAQPGGAGAPGGGWGSGRPGRAWLLRIPGKCLTHTGEEAAAARRAGKAASGAGCSCGRPSSAAALARPSLRTRCPGKLGAGGRLREPSRSRRSCRAASRGRGTPGAGPQGGHALHPSRCFRRPLSDGKGRRDSLSALPTPPHPPGTRREGRPHPAAPPTPSARIWALPA